MPSYTLVDPWAMPGMGTPAETTEREFLSGTINSWYIKGCQLAAGTVDARSTVTSDLQRGLVMGIVTATGAWTQYSATATNGSQVARGILYRALSMLDSTGATAIKQGSIVIFAVDVKNAELGGLDAQARQQLRGRIIFDDDYAGNYSPEWRQELAKTMAYTVTAADKGSLFTNVGAVGSVTFTLPALAVGLKYGFLVVADQTVIVASVAGDDMVTPNDASADSVAFQTGGDKIGGMVVVYTNVAGTKWYVEKRSSNAMTIAT